MAKKDFTVTSNGKSFTVPKGHYVGNSPQVSMRLPHVFRDPEKVKNSVGIFLPTDYDMHMSPTGVSASASIPGIIGYHPRPLCRFMLIKYVRHKVLQLTFLPTPDLPTYGKAAFWWMLTT